METGNRILITLVIALATTVANGSLFVLHRPFETDTERAAPRCASPSSSAWGEWRTTGLRP